MPAFEHLQHSGRPAWALLHSSQDEHLAATGRCPATRADMGAAGEGPAAYETISTNPAKQGVDNPQRPRTEQQPFASWEDLTKLASRIGAAVRAARHIRRGDRTATKRMGRARAPRHRPRHSSALRLPSVPQRPAQMPENRSQRPRRATTSDRARRARPATNQPPLPTRVPRPQRRLPRPAQLPAALLDSCPARSRHPASAKDLRSKTHVRDVRSTCGHLDLRPLPLHGRQSDHDRPPLRPPRQRRPPTRDRPTRRPHARAIRRGRWWTFRGRHNGHPSPVALTRDSGLALAGQTDKALCRTRTDDPFLTIARRVLQCVHDA